MQDVRNPERRSGAPIAPRHNLARCRGLLGRLFLLLDVTALAACGTYASVRTMSNVGASSNGEGGTDADLAADGAARDAVAMSSDALAPWCPTTAPSNNAPCQWSYTPRSLTIGADGGAAPTGSVYQIVHACEYGGNPRCAAYATCASSPSPSWWVIPPDPSCSGNAVGCPAAIEATADAGLAGWTWTPGALEPAPASQPSCMPGSSCTYDVGRCICSRCGGGGDICASNACGTLDAGTVWSCFDWQETQGCPVPRPLLGTKCTTARQICAYTDIYLTIGENGLDPHPAMICDDDGYWSLLISGGGC